MSSSLLQSFRDVFSDSARLEGDEYASSGRVRDVHVDRSEVRGQVKGTSLYSVSIAFGRGVEGLGCTCPAFERVGPCKHIWALLRVIAKEDAEAADAMLSLVHDGVRSDFAGFDDTTTDGGAAERAPATWQERLANLRRTRGSRPVEPSNPKRNHEIRYAIDLEESGAETGLVFRSLLVRRDADGHWGEPQTWVPWVRGSQRQMNPADYEIFTLIRGADEALLRRTGMGTTPLGLGWSGVRDGVFHLGADLTEVLASKLVATGRLYVWKGDGELAGPIGEDDGPPWRFRVRVTRDDVEAVLSGAFERGEERMGADRPLAVLDGGLLVLPDQIARFEGSAESTVLRELRQSGELRVPAEHEGLLAHSLLADPAIEPSDVDGLVVRADLPPTPCLFVESPTQRGFRGASARRNAATKLGCRVSFRYGGATVDADALERGVILANRVPVLRDLDRERAQLDRLFELGMQPLPPDEEHAHHGTVTAGRLRDLIPDLLAEGWNVEAEGRHWRTVLNTSVSVRSGIDWFELEGGARYGDEIVSLPKLLAAARAGMRTVELGDGSVGVLPEKWLAQWNLLDIAAEVEGDALRFTPSQGVVLDALLAARDGEIQVDDRFREARQRWRDFREVQPREEPDGFCTELRPYQREGLGWLNALRELGLGGCLADDMGLGKTVQVLALLEQLRLERERQSAPHLPSLVVAPRSLVFNWIAEAHRFAPGLEVLDYTGPSRKSRLARFDEVDVVITTYGTLRRDAAVLADRHFDVCVLDEAQAIKNASSQAAKAARLIRADQRLALSGTPIENNLRELWSLMEYLEPGLLGRATAFRQFLKTSATEEGDELSTLARSIAPFFLRRTKEAVCEDLPEKSELVLTCQLSKPMRKEYDELREHYRRALLLKADESGMNKIRMHVLEGLMRLRQAACHPGLIDAERRGEESAKLEVLIPMLEELTAEGHKALVFSQFTSFLSIVRERLDELEIPYAYLDGQTRNREETVRRFQEDGDCPLFLVSLKAGGSGLNLTAADYVFLLDPWWNPATEAQAVDRAHRIGRTRPVIAYRLITADTVEERVRELQERKRELTDALFSDSGGGLSNLTREDLEALFGDPSA